MRKAEPVWMPAFHVKRYFDEGPNWGPF
jgi:hypothetical protein